MAELAEGQGSKHPLVKLMEMAGPARKLEYQAMRGQTGGSVGLKDVSGATTMIPTAQMGQIQADAMRTPRAPNAQDQTNWAALSKQLSPSGASQVKSFLNPLSYIHAAHDAWKSGDYEEAVTQLAGLAALGLGAGSAASGAVGAAGGGAAAEAGPIPDAAPIMEGDEFANAQMRDMAAAEKGAPQVGTRSQLSAEELQRISPKPAAEGATGLEHPTAPAPASETLAQQAGGLEHPLAADQGAQATSGPRAAPKPVAAPKPTYINPDEGVMPGEPSGARAKVEAFNRSIDSEIDKDPSLSAEQKADTRQQISQELQKAGDSEKGLLRRILTGEPWTGSSGVKGVAKMGRLAAVYGGGVGGIWGIIHKVLGDHRSSTDMATHQQALSDLVGTLGLDPDEMARMKRAQAGYEIMTDPKINPAAANMTDEQKNTYYSQYIIGTLQQISRSHDQKAQVQAQMALAAEQAKPYIRQLNMIADDQMRWVKRFSSQLPGNLATLEMDAARAQTIGTRQQANALGLSAAYGPVELANQLTGATATPSASASSSPLSSLVYNSVDTGPIPTLTGQ